MRIIRRPMTTLALTLACGSACAQQVQPQLPAGQLVREVVYNEQHDHQTHGYWRYWVERRSQNHTLLDEQVETKQGPLERLVQVDGHPLPRAQQQQEEERLQSLLASPAEQERSLHAYQENEERIGRVLALLPDAFLYRYAGSGDGCYRLSFWPNPNYAAHGIEARIFHAMSGTLWVDARSKRLARLEGRVDQNVDFGFGILGRLYKGGWFRLDRVQVGGTDWKTARLEVHMNVRALLVKAFARETSEVRGGFEPVSADLSLAQGRELLDSLPVLARSSAGSGAQARIGVAGTLAMPVAFDVQH